MKIRRMRGLLAAVATASVLVSGVAPAQAAAKKVITVWADDQRGPQLQALIGNNTTIAPGYVIKVKFFSGLDALQSAWGKASAAGGPDVLTGPASFTLSAKSGKLLPLVYSAAVKKAMPAGAVSAMSYKNRPYGVALDIDTTAMFWNKKFGPVPTSLKAMIDQYKTLKNSGDVTGGICAFEGTWGSNPILTALGGGAWAFKKGQPDFSKTLINSADFKKNIDLLLGNDGKSNGFFQWDGCADDFKNGKIMAANTGAWNLGSIKGTGMDYSISAVPGLNGGTGQQWVNYSGAWVTSFAQKHGVALGAKKLVLDFFASKRGQAMMYAASGRPPANPEALTLVSNKDTKAFVKAASTGIAQFSAYLDNNKGGSNWYDTLGSVYNKIFVNGENASSTLDSAAAILLTNFADAKKNN